MNSEQNPWVKTESKQIYDNPWIRVTEDQVIRPNGTPGIYGHVHMKNKAIGIIPLDGKQYTWLVGQFRYTLNTYSWEIPTGGGPIRDDIEDSALRELKEETGLTAGSLTNILHIHTSNSITDEEGFVFLAQELTQGDTDFDDTEVISVKRIPFDEALNMVLDGQITDSLSIAGILKLARILGI
jgi:8-oxo-dGTP pyrophosphatase MutT (NUDIX family)